ncbi:hypothetical protein [Psychrobacillus sp. FSL H8-0510]|uniref:hypothetical protein n=2 Tax=unclassified Psychrobacillus TaxID=2636677 RepID=UPI0030F7B04E
MAKKEQYFTVIEKGIILLKGVVLMKATVEQLENFFKEFHVEVDSMATQTLCFADGKFTYEETDVYGETAFIRLETAERNSIVEFEGNQETEQVDAWAVAFDDLKQNVDAFITKVEEEHKENNLI